MDSVFELRRNGKTVAENRFIQRKLSGAVKRFRPIWRRGVFAGDLDGNGVPDLIVGADGDDNGGGGVDRGAAWILFLNTNGQVNYSRKLSSTDGGFNIPLSNLDRFATSISSAGDRNGDGVPDLLVGAPLDDTGGTNRGAVYTVFLNSGGVLPAVHLVSFARQTPSQNPTSADSLVFRAVFSDAVQNVDVNDFQVHGQSTATVTDVTKFSDNTYYLTVSGGDLSIFSGIVGVDLATTLDIADLNGTRIPIAEPNVDETYTLVHLDYGDAPDRSPGTGPAQQAGNVFLPINYNTLSSDNGPSHATTRKLYMGSAIDTETEAVQGPTGLGDDLNQGLDDEDGLQFPAEDLILFVGDRPRVRIKVTNITGGEASLYGWIDFNGDGVFNNATERATMVLPDGIVDGTVTLEFPQVPLFTGIRSAFARFRISTDAAAANPTGLAGDGEVEDYPVSIKVDTLVSRDASGNLVVKDIEIESNDTLTIQSDTANQQYIITDSNLVVATSIVGAIQIDAHEVVIPFSLVTGSSIVVDTLGGDDTLTVDFALGKFAKSIDYRGGVQNTDDRLVLVGGSSFATVTHFLETEGVGGVSVSGSELIWYGAVENLVDTLNASSRVFSFLGGDETISLSDDAQIGNGLSRIDSTRSSVVDFRTATGLVLLDTWRNGGFGLDQILVTGLDSVFDCNLHISGHAKDSVTFLSHPTSIGTGSLLVTAWIIGVETAIYTSLNGSVTLTATRNVLINNAGSIASEDGDIILEGNVARQAIGENFSGVSVQGASIRSRNGSIRLAGSGGTIGASLNYGVFLIGTHIETTGDNTNSSIRITGIGSGEGFAAGVFLGGCTIASKSSKIVIKGTGGSNLGNNNLGVFIQSAKLSTLGTAGGIEINGVAGSGQQNNFGVLLTDSQLSAVSGSVDIFGTAGSTGDVGSNENDGVRIVAGTTIASTGSGSNAATISIIGFGGVGDDNNDGVIIWDAGTLISSIEGAITVQGAGASNGGNDSDSSAGVAVEFGATIMSTGVGPTSAPITLRGVGGKGDDGNNGVSVTSQGIVTSIDGDISLIGTGGSNGLALSTLNHGVAVFDRGRITSTGTGNDAGQIIITGSGGSGDDFNIGIGIYDANSLVSSVDGDISLNGIGGSNGQIGSTNNHGVLLFSGATVSSFGIGSDAARVSIEGTGGSGDGTNEGVVLDGVGTALTSVDGAVSILGVGGPKFSEGILVQLGATIASTGIGANAATLTLHGRAGAQSGVGVKIVDQGTSVTSIDGDIAINGSMFSNVANASSNNCGVWIAVGAAVSSLGVGGGAANLLIEGTGGNGHQDNFGVVIFDLARISAIDGDLYIRGNGGANGLTDSSYNAGIVIQSASILSLGTGSDASRIELVGTGGIGGIGNAGVHTLFAHITSIAGDISVIGNGGSNRATGSLYSYGVYLGPVTQISSTGIGPTAAKIRIRGYGGAGEFDNDGVRISSNAQLISRDGAIAVDGTGGSNESATSNDNDGVVLELGAKIASIGIGANAATLALYGRAGAQSGVGVKIIDQGTSITSIDGDMAILGAMHSSLANAYSLNDGVRIANGAEVSSLGTGSHAANLFIEGDAGNGETENIGVSITGSTTRLSTVDGDLTIRGNGGSNGLANSGANYGVFINQSQISSLGIGSDAGRIELVGTGGKGGVGNMGVAIGDSMTRIYSIDGDLTIRGQGGSNGQPNSFRNFGIVINRATISSTGTGSNAARVELVGIGGNGGEQNNGVTVWDSARISSIAGDISVTGNGGSTGNISNRQGIGVFLADAAQVNSTGVWPNAAKIRILGSGGAGEFDNDGVHMSLNSQLNSRDGAITVDGTGGSNESATSNDNDGVVLELGAKISSTGTGPNAASISIKGVGGVGLHNNSGVAFLPNVTLNSIDGDIQIVGTGASRADSYECWGVVGVGLSVASTGTGPDAASISILGVSGEGNNHNIGVSLFATQLTAISGAVQVNGTGRSKGAANSNSNYGVQIDGLTHISSNGVGPLAATISVRGTGGSGNDDNAGVIFLDRSKISSIDGDIHVSGTGGSNGRSDSEFNVGVRMLTGASIYSLGGGPDAASILLDGSGGSGGTSNHGVLLQDSNTQLTTVDGDIQVIGQAASKDEVAPAFASGVSMMLNASIISNGVGPNAGTITLTGNGGRVGSQNSGVQFTTLAKVTSRDGDISITGTGGANTGNNSDGSGGVVLLSGAVLESSGIGANAASININGNGGRGGNFNTGIIASESGTTIRSVDGAIRLSGVGGGVSAVGLQNHGVTLSNRSIIQATGAGNVDVSGQAGEGTNQYAILVSDNSSLITFAGQLILTATDTPSAHDDILVANTATLQSRILDVSLRAGDELTLEAGSKVSAANGTIICIGDYGDADPSVGSTLNLLGTLVNGQVGNISGGNDQDRIVVNPALGNSINRFLLDGRGGDDSYVIQFGRFGGVGKLSGITIADSGVSDSDRAQLMGTNASESFKVQNLTANGVSPQTGGFVENITIGEKVTYSNSLEFVEVHGDPQPNQPGLGNNDTFGVQPSQTAAIHVHGGNPKLGDPNTPGGNPVGTGDVLNFDSLGNPYLNSNRQISTSGGNPSPFKVVTYEDIETALSGPTVESLVVNDGQKQRSRVNSLTITFSQVVTLDSNAISVVRVSDNQSIQLSISLSIIGGKTVAALTFSGTGTEFGSLADGNYRVTVQQGRVRAPDGAVLASNYVDDVFRLFGDADGDRDTDNLDFLGFMKILGAKVGDANYRWFLDINGDGKIDNSDRVAISSRVGRRI